MTCIVLGAAVMADVPPGVGAYIMPAGRLFDREWLVAYVVVRALKGTGADALTT